MDHLQIYHTAIYMVATISLTICMAVAIVIFYWQSYNAETSQLLAIIVMVTTSTANVWITFLFCLSSVAHDKSLDDKV